MERRTPLVAQKSANSCEGVLAAAVAVEDDACGGFAGHECGGEGLDDQGGAQVVGDGVADHLAGVQVDHGRGVDPAIDGAHIGNVSAPASVRCFGAEVPPDQIRGVDGALTCDGRFLPGSWVASAQASGPHEPPDPFGGNPHPAYDELGEDPAYAGVAMQFGVDLADRLGELGV